MLTSERGSALAFGAVIVAALGLAGLLMLPRIRAGDPPPPEPAPPPDARSAPPAASSSSAPPPPPPAYVRVDPAAGTACAAGMVLVDGIYCPFVAHTCAAFADEPRDLCQSYAPDVVCEGQLAHRRFCIDVFEYPNLEGVLPAVMVDWNEARRACHLEGKRICTVEEWEFACEGPQMWPYPYGTERDATACNIDKDERASRDGTLTDPWKISDEVERLDQRVAAGEPRRCVSPFGVHDMTGNVDEWAENIAGGREEKPFRSALKGGSWGPTRARCRPVTTTHDERFSSNQVGFRCCADARGGQRASSPAAGITMPRKRRMDQP